MIDGRYIRTHHIGTAKIRRGDFSQILDSINDNVDGLSYSRKFRFSQLNIGKASTILLVNCSDCSPGEDDKAVNDSMVRQIRKVGRISLQFCYVESVTERKPSRRSPEEQRARREEALTAISSITENSLKGEANSHKAG